MSMPGTETVRFRRPTNKPEEKKEPEKDQFGAAVPQGWKRRHQGLLQDQLRRQQNGPMVPSFSVALRLLLLLRTVAAMYSIISDCDEVFNFYEPLHYFIHNSGFQTWEQSPEYSVRSWFYVLLHAPLAQFGPWLLSLGKREQFFALRFFLGVICSVCEARFFRAVVDGVNERVGRYVLFAMFLSAGMFSASVAFLPSSFAMYANMLAASFWFHPATSTNTGVKRAFLATLSVAIGAIVGWPFAAALGIPFVIEYALLPAGEICPPTLRLSWGQKRLSTLVGAIVVSAAVAIPVVAVDSWAYGRLTFPSLNIILYNVFGNLGPDLYGTESAAYYFKNLFLNFNFLLPLALISLPALAVTYKYDFRRLGKTQMKPREGETSPYTLLAIRLTPFYIWLLVFTAQAHKEERFMYPAYPFLCFNACVSIYLIRGWMETVYVNITKSPYRAAQLSVFSWFTLLCVVVPSLLSFGRIMAMIKFYSAPTAITNHFQYHTLPSVLAEMGYEPLPVPKNMKERPEEHIPEWDLSPLADLEEPLRVCYGAEWHRFPSSFLYPAGVEVQWIRGAFDGMMPRRWDPSSSVGWWPRSETRAIHLGRFNNANKASTEPGTFVVVDSCNYLVTLNLPSQPPTEAEPDYISDPTWEVEKCVRFLDAASSRGWARWLWLPGGIGEGQRVYGQYCLLRRAAEVA